MAADPLQCARCVHSSCSTWFHIRIGVSDIKTLFRSNIDLFRNMERPIRRRLFGNFFALSIAAVKQLASKRFSMIKVVHAWGNWKVPPVEFFSCEVVGASPPSAPSPTIVRNSSGKMAGPLNPVLHGWVLLSRQSKNTPSQWICDHPKTFAI